ncbi:MAG: lipopolysaccharide biosynthesis protein RfbH [Candidatus Sericytochromatia bacterium]|nr:lipopolysaccharide biosynthesis protein RfbH [Candidatus Sericytochromatia bacterium]
MIETPEQLKADILSLVERYHAAAHAKPPFTPGVSAVPYAGRWYDASDMLNLVDSSLDFWLTAGPYAARFEAGLRDLFQAHDCAFVNSGSSANLLMVSALCAIETPRLLRGDDPPALQPGDEVITPAVTFPTTLTPILQNGLVPVFVDCELDTYNVNAEAVAAAVGPRTRAMFIPHTVGLPAHLDALQAVAREHNLWLLEDGCDALGGRWNGKIVGSFGAMSSLSFFPAHHITTGEGGAVVVNHPRLRKVLRSLRDWGRDCWCDPGVSDTCRNRFGWQMGDLPAGYDHKYIYSNHGYNLKATDMQAAIGVAQLARLEQVTALRQRNFRRYQEGLADVADALILPRVFPQADPSPFGFPLTVREGLDCRRLVAHLQASKIETRQVFGGNILRQPGFMNIPRRVYGNLEVSDRIMRDTIFVGVWPGMTLEMVDYVVAQVRDFVQHGG